MEVFFILGFLRTVPAPAADERDAGRHHSPASNPREEGDYYESQIFPVQQEPSSGVSPFPAALPGHIVRLFTDQNLRGAGKRLGQFPFLPEGSLREGEETPGGGQGHQGEPAGP